VNGVLYVCRLAYVPTYKHIIATPPPQPTMTLLIGFAIPYSMDTGSTVPASLGSGVSEGWQGMKGGS
jgi:hypothetical protein